MTKKEILVEVSKNNGHLFWAEDYILKAMDTYLIQELKSLLDDCKGIRPENITDLIKNNISILEDGV